MSSFRRRQFYHYTLYIYIYIYCHSQLISVARHARRLKLGLRPGQLYVSLITQPHSHHSLDVSEGI